MAQSNGSAGGHGVIHQQQHQQTRTVDEIDDLEVGVDRGRNPPYCYTEVRNLIWINGIPVYHEALKEWDRKTDFFKQSIERKKKQSGDLRNEIYQLAGFFSVFQGVLLTAVSQSNLLHCNNWWSPVALSALASAVSIAGVAQKFSVIRSLEETIHSESQACKESVKRAQDLRRKGPDFRFSEHRDDPRKRPKKSIAIYMFVVILTLLLFSGVFLASHVLILCDSDQV